ncbi:nitrophenyl compound nitroreductase subunit ArsF family protein [Candidatus Bipolaricaulota bacterium]
MKLAKSVLTILLLLFVGATVGTLIAQEVSRPATQVAEEVESTPSVEPIAVSVGETPTSEPPVSEVSGSTEVATPEGIGAVGGASERSPVEASTTIAPCVIEAIYFHNTNRCVTCLKIEGDAKAIVEREFAEELAAGKLRWSTINMEEERAYISRYDLVSPSLVLTRKVGDEVVGWTTLTETWALVRSATRFASYIVECFQAFLGECP